MLSVCVLIGIPIVLLMWSAYTEIEERVETGESYRYFEYKTPKPQSKWRRRWKIGLRVFWVIWILPIAIGCAIESNFIMFLALIAILCILIYATFRYDPTLTVLILDKIIFLRYHAGRTLLRKYIPLRQIKDVFEVTHTKREFFTHPLNKYYTFKFDDETGWNGNEAHGADMELDNGKHFYVSFNGVEKFVETVKERQAALS